MRWTRELNLSLLRAYFTVTDLGRDCIGYRYRLEEMWNLEHPNLPMNGQRLADQTRSILKRKAVSDSEIEDIKRQIQNRVNVSHHNTTQPSLSETPDFQPNITDSQEIRSEEESCPDKHISETFHQIAHATEANEHNTKFLPRIKTDFKARETIRRINKLLEQELNEKDTYEDTIKKVYIAALTTYQILGLKTPNKEFKHNKQSKVPPWEKRLCQKVEEARKEIGIMQNFLNFNKDAEPPKLKKKVTKIARMTTMSNNQYRANLTTKLEELKQKLAVWKNRLKRYKKRANRFKANQLFNQNQKQFYRELDKEIVPDKVPNENEMHEFWANIWQNEATHDSTAYWIEEEKQNNKHIREMPETYISEQDVTYTVSTLKNWSAPGIDMIQNFWWKVFPATHKYLAIQFNKMLDNPKCIPNSFAKGKTIMIPKSKDSTKPENFRPITCLNTCYKIFTSIITQKVSAHIDKYNVLCKEQHGCRRHAKGCKEALIIDSIIASQAKTRNRNISIAWIDYRKAYDSVPHSWLKSILEIYKIDTKLRIMLENLMATWKTQLHYQSRQIEIQTSEIEIKRGIYQGDSFSTLWFCLSLNPLSNLLINNPYAYNITPQQKITHQFYIDDLKLYAKGPQQLQNMLELLSCFSKTIHMKLGIEKCNILHLKRGKVNQNGSILLTDGTEIHELQEGETYKYLGIEQALREDKSTNKEKFIKTLTTRIDKILKTPLNARNTIEAINVWAIPTIRYSFGVVHWNRTEIKQLDIKVRTLLTKSGQHHPKSAIERLYLPRDKGGRGLINLEQAYEEEIKKLTSYFKNSTQPLLKTLCNLDKKFSPLCLGKMSSESKTMINPETFLENWAAKTIHGRFYHNLYQTDVALRESCLYLTEGYLFPESEGMLLSIQDQVVHTRVYRKSILKEPLENVNCRLGCHQTETIQHIISGCSKLAQTAYLSRHNEVAKIIHQELTLRYKHTATRVPYYKYTPETIHSNNDNKLFWDSTVYTDRTITHNRPDIMVLEKTTKTLCIIDIGIPLDDNLEKVYQEKIHKYSPLAEELRTIWEIRKVKILPIIISANGLIHKNLPAHLDDLGITRRSISAMQKATILGTIGTVRRFLSK